MKEGGYSVAYADDLLCMIEADNKNEIEDVGTEVMEMVVGWGNEVGVQISMEKTVMTLLKRPFPKSRPSKVRVQEKRLKYVKEGRYLGVRVSERMNFRRQVESLRGRVIGAMGKLRRVLRKEWSLNKRTIGVIYLFSLSMNNLDFFALCPTDCCFRKADT
ncbi:hypothetical protein Zmor_017717 [Zophobas morio]|uniref:Reverse transcriptase domain-containing protein n=1 Tax=Zophobas morio TaxID=2755281 RepID=A0AA38MD38_9CUCU|nr:hypothetical protein Zmor_017717 [Zophobas morio]